MMMILADPDIDAFVSSHWCLFCVPYVCRNLHHSTTLNYTEEHKSTLPKILNNIAFSLYRKRMSFGSQPFVS